MATKLDQIERRLSILEAEVKRIEERTCPRFGMTLDEFNARSVAHQANEANDEEWEELLGVLGIGDGPPELSSHFRDYLHGEES